MEGMNFCPQCGQRARPDTRFCEQCGADLGSPDRPLEADGQRTVNEPQVPTCPKCNAPVRNYQPYGSCATCREPFSDAIDAQMKALGWAAASGGAATHTQPGSARQWLEKSPNARLILLYGVGSGLLCFPANFAARMACTSCCPYRGIVGGLPLLFIPFLAALMVSLFADWRRIPYDAAVGVGTGIGLRTGLLSAVSGFLVIVATEVGFLVLGAAQYAGATDLQRAFGQTELQMTVPATVYTIVIAAAFAAFGTGLGVLGGGLGAALKRSPSVR
jgi:hypothetical protein